MPLADNMFNQGLPIEVCNESDLIGEDDISGLHRNALGLNIPVVSELASEHPDEGATNETVEEPYFQFEFDAFVSQQLDVNSFPEEVNYSRLREASNETLYEGCTSFSKLAFILHLFHLKCMVKWPDKFFSMLIDLLHYALPQIQNFPSSHYQAKKLIMDLGIGYEKIHACPNDCILYWGEMKEKDSCSKYATSRWKSETYKDKVPAKVMRFFLLIPRLRRTYMSSKISNDMRWHDEFVKDARSVRLGLASDGFNPYRLMNTTYSIW